MPGPAPASLTLPEMLQGLARERATGVLRVQGAEGWKVLDIQTGAIHLVTGTEGQRLRLGDILVARGKITRQDVHAALDAQRTTALPLGEVLAQRGLISRSEILDVVRFQIEEEIYDLFTWKGAECSFEPNATLGAQVEGYPDAAKLATDPRRILGEAARRISEWQRIENTIYSAHMTLQLTERGHSMLDTATRGGRRLLELIQEGYSVESIVHKAMVGRFAIWKSLADLIDAQAVIPISDEELDELAEAWESEGKLEQALGAYLRLSEVTPDRVRNGEYRGNARVLREQLASLDEEVRPGVLDIGSRPSRDLRTPILAVATGLIVIAAATYVTFRVTSAPSAEDLAPYYEALAEASGLEKLNKLDEARHVWAKYLARYPEGAGADMAQEAHNRIEERYEGNVDIMIRRAEELKQNKDFTAAMRVYDDILVRYSDTKKRTQIAALRAKADTDWAAYTQTLSRQQVAETLKRGRDLLEDKRFSESMSYLQTVVNSNEAGPELRNEARALLSILKKAEEKAQVLIGKAQALEKEGKLDEAINTYKKCFDHWQKSRSGRIAADKLTDLGQQRARAKRLYERGLRCYSDGDFTGAVGHLKRTARYKGFHVAEMAQKKLDRLAGANKRSQELLKRAKRLEAQGQKEEAFKTLVELVEQYPHTLAARKTLVEVRIESVPSGARATLNRKRIGTTPVTVKLSPNRAGTVSLAMTGFARLEKEFEKVDSPVMLFHLQREVLYTKNLGRQIGASPAGAEGRMVVRSEELLTLLLMANGALIWQAEAGPAGSKRAKAAIMEDTVYAGTDKPQLLAFYLSTGSRRAEYALPSPPVTAPAPIRLSLLAGRLFVIVGCRNGEVVSLDVMAGRAHWTGRVTPPIRFDPAVTDKSVVVPSPGGQVVAFDILRGGERWRESVPGEVAGDLATDERGEYVAAVTSLGELYVFSAADGGKMSRILVDGVHGGGVTLNGSRAYIGCDDGTVRAVETLTGRKLWKRDVDGAVRDEPVVHAGTVYVCTEADGEGSVVALDAETGAEQWRLRTRSPVVAAGIAGKDRLVVGTVDGELIGLEIGPVDARRR